MLLICFCAGAYLNRAADVVCWWPQECADENDEEEENRLLRAVHGAMQAALEINRIGFTQWRDPSTVLMQQQPRTPEQASHFTSAIVLIRATYHDLLNYALSTSTGGACWRRLRVTCAIPASEEAALLQLAEQSPAELRAALADTANSSEVTDLVMHNVSAARQQRAAADMARHGLRACALPECARRRSRSRRRSRCAADAAPSCTAARRISRRTGAATSAPTAAKPLHEPHAGRTNTHCNSMQGCSSDDSAISGLGGGAP
jgi:hypothetical protein